MRFAWYARWGSNPQPPDSESDTLSNCATGTESMDYFTTGRTIMVNTSDIKLIVCDVDNTIIPAGEQAISRRLKRAFDSAMDKGIHILVDTGRHYTFLQESLFDDLPLEFIGTINGACLVDRQGRVIEKHTMSLDSMNRITEICEQNDIGLGFKFEDAVVTYANHDKFVDGYCKSDIRLRNAVINDDEKRTHHLKYGLPIGVFIIGKGETIEQYRDAVPEMAWAWSYKDGYDIFIKDTNKATAVEPVLKHYGITWDNVIAFGDAGNDTPFIRKAAIGVALGNAKDDVKQYADIVADECVNDGAAKVLEELGIV